MGRQPDHKALEVLNRISDVIVNHYEEGYRYTARELRQILDAIIAILDADRAAGADPALIG
jgi:hypothetical protein